MDTNIPYYLRQNVQVDPMGTVNIFNQDNWDVPITTAKKSESLWDDLSQSVDNGLDVVYDGVSGTWKSVANTAKEGLSSIKEGIESTVSEIKWNLLYIFVGLIVLIIVLAKTGVFKVVGQVLTARA